MCVIQKKHEEFPLEYQICLSIRRYLLMWRDSPSFEASTPPFPAPGNHCSWRRDRASLFQNGHAFLLESFVYLSDQHLTFFCFCGEWVFEWISCSYKWFDQVGHEVALIVGRRNISILYYLIASCCRADSQFRVWPCNGIFEARCQQSPTHAIKHHTQPESQPQKTCFRYFQLCSSMSFF